jgi:hypothetical protein
MAGSRVSSVAPPPAGRSSCAAYAKMPPTYTGLVGGISLAPIGGARLGRITGTGGTPVCCLAPMVAGCGGGCGGFGWSRDATGLTRLTRDAYRA